MQSEKITTEKINDTPDVITKTIVIGVIALAIILGIVFGGIKLFSLLDASQRGAVVDKIISESGNTEPVSSENADYVPIGTEPETIPETDPETEAPTTEIPTKEQPTSEIVSTQQEIATEEVTAPPTEEPTVPVTEAPARKIAEMKETDSHHFELLEKATNTIGDTCSNALALTADIYYSPELDWSYDADVTYYTYNDNTQKLKGIISVSDESASDMSVYFEISDKNGEVLFQTEPFGKVFQPQQIEIEIPANTEFVTFKLIGNSSQNGCNHSAVTLLLSDFTIA